LTPVEVNVLFVVFGFVLGVISDALSEWLNKREEARVSDSE
jgi:hypothetical protein